MRKLSLRGSFAFRHHRRSAAGIAMLILGAMILGHAGFLEQLGSTLVLAFMHPSIPSKRSTILSSRRQHQRNYAATSTPRLHAINGEQEETIAFPNPPSIYNATGNKHILSSGLLSPFHILYPETFSTSPAPLNVSAPLQEVLRYMKESLRVLLQPPQTSFEERIRQPSILRLEMRISHKVDPLCWLQAQIENNPQELRANAAAESPTFYFASAEGTLETAVFGSSQTHRDALQEDDAWQRMVARLPDRARVYGGQRFDTGTVPAEEWQDFSKGYWMIPAVELRREQNFKSFDTTLAIHLVEESIGDNYDESKNRFESSILHVLNILENLTDEMTSAVPPTTLPPVLSRSSTYERRQCDGHTGHTEPTTQQSSPFSTIDGQEIYERGVTAALQEFSKSQWKVNETSIDTNTAENSLKKVVLARRMDLRFAPSAYASVCALDILRKWKFASQPGGHLFYLSPGGSDSEFFGCTPERLFQVYSNKSLDSTMVVSEALAGTRPRGSTPAADQELSRQLFSSAKDQAENKITGRFIMEAFNEMNLRGWVETRSKPHISKDESQDNGNDVPIDDVVGGTIQGKYFVRRLRHLQHICQRFQCQLSTSDVSADAIQYLLSSLHPTPAVGGYPKESAMDFIRRHEGIGFDRGFYSGPVGFVGRKEAEIVVAIRSGLVSQGSKSKDNLQRSAQDVAKRPKVSVYAGAGLVPGSTVQGEWAETAYKLAVVSSIFPQSPVTLQSFQTPNSAWATAFIEELIRNGVTQFYVCPGSRSTPLVAAVAKAVRSNVGVVHAMSVHDERGAAFRALGYGRGTGRPAAVITSSGTAVANLYPAVVEAGMDGVPLLLLTADRPYESRDTGANQAIDQVKAYSQSYIRWFRDILPPHDDVPVSAALADAAHGVTLCRKLMGPVHLNIQFRENLAPDAGPIRNDDRTGSVTTFNNVRFTDSAGFNRWSLGGRRWTQTFSSSPRLEATVLIDILRSMTTSKRGIIVVGNVRTNLANDARQHDTSRINQLIERFAQEIGFPIFAGVQSGSLRFECDAVVPFAEHLLRCPVVHENLKPDLIIQLGAPLISVEIPKIIKKTINEGHVRHILVHAHHPHERADPEFTVTQNINTDIESFVKDMLELVTSGQYGRIGSELASMVELGRLLQQEMPKIVEDAASYLRQLEDSFEALTEPEVVMKLSQMLSSGNAPEISMFLSNSMSVRDADAFLYPLHGKTSNQRASLVGAAGVNRGASGIDGVIASAAGYADATGRPTTLLIGDVATLHDINSLHALRTGMTAAEAQAQKIHPLTIVVLNNDGGGIFSFLPIAKHGNDVSFDEYFGTPTNTFSFEKGAQAFDLPYLKASNSSSFDDAYDRALSSNHPFIIEAVVASRERNVAVHKEITKQASTFISKIVKNEDIAKEVREILPLKHVRAGGLDGNDVALGEKSLVLLHGWMGEISDWHNVVSSLQKLLPPEWSIISVDLPGHGSSMIRRSTGHQLIQDALNVGESDGGSTMDFSLDEMALTVAATLKAYGLAKIDALAGYSMGGRVAMAMKRLSMPISNGDTSYTTLVDDDTKMILLSTYPGKLRGREEIADKDRVFKDECLAKEIEILSNFGTLSQSSPEAISVCWSKFLNKWYSAPIWGAVRKEPTLYSDMLQRRLVSLSNRGRDLAAVLSRCSPPKCSSEDWRGVNAKSTLYLVGKMDKKYGILGREWVDLEPSLTYVEITNAGHALLVEAGEEVSKAIASFLLQKKEVEDQIFRDGTKIWDATFIPTISVEEISSKTVATDTQSTGSVGSLEFEPFSINVIDKVSSEDGVLGIGWGQGSKATKEQSLKQRSGFFVQVLSSDGLNVGVGEVSPLKGLHPETYQMAWNQLEQIANSLSSLEPDLVPLFDARSVLSLDGSLESYITSLEAVLGIERVLPSVRSGIEMAILSLSSQIVRMPIQRAITVYSPKAYAMTKTVTFLPLNGLLTRSSRDPADKVQTGSRERNYPSWKIKVGNQSRDEDRSSLKNALVVPNTVGNKIRLDANRAFSETSYLCFVDDFKAFLASSKFESIEYIEEPLQKQTGSDVAWSINRQVDALEKSFNETAIPYALDESVYDLLQLHDNNFVAVTDDLSSTFARGTRGCAAIVLKPSLLGLEVSLRLARFVKSKLGISAVFTSSFDSGIGLAYASFLASLSDASPARPGTQLYPHGLSTFDRLTSDGLSPPFGSYVNQEGVLNVASLSRAFYGLALDELQSLSSESLPPPLPALDKQSLLSSEEMDTAAKEIDGGQPAGAGPGSNLLEDDFEASTSSSGRDIVLVASLPLPFSADIACARFTDLPQQPRWSPWLASVAYLDAGSETEWTLRVRGVNFRWRAKSEMLVLPYKGIRWKSTSGVKNTGVVEFVPPSGGTSASNSCTMKVRMAFVVPRLLSSLFRGTIVEDFLRNKIMKWSLEMFRDVVKGDLALEEGNIELGDALFGAVEGKASAIEATLASSSTRTPDRSSRSRKSVEDWEQEQ
ncbi:2-succinyl-6-hydroxy-2,4-cyclohexadiene-1-carboxylic acid synthase/2-oxoglutarate decarboxylase [Nitzschia inconspicua]|uniref:2-succinyl-6-hydroxy-2, 4-cyclohexadiene-1-carboxylic acid synthase/2-oxoglutarate decarboxylase n=1 Tax=Nitzschia inconspicua TaxID=303405 RepID=A0A9K3PDY4_9STRA|nr:2-succinyl-6-hydroxy-2,4-cyclohexadiene-1-carboxylic acid synthase/2-oxoglutarate decarboxylase [Nitzschia inconspicua]